MDRTTARLATLLTGAFFISSSCSDSMLPRGESDSPQRKVEALFVNSGFETGNTSSWAVTTNLVAQSPGVQVYPVTSESQLGLRAGGVLEDERVRRGHAVLAHSSRPLRRRPRALPALRQLGRRRERDGRAVQCQPHHAIVGGDDHRGIDPADGLVHVRFVVLPVLQNPGHSLREQPYYFVSITNTTKGTTLASRFNFSNEAGVPWQSTANGQVGLHRLAVVRPAALSQRHQHRRRASRPRSSRAAARSRATGVRPSSTASARAFPGSSSTAARPTASRRAATFSTPTACSTARRRRRRARS